MRINIETQSACVAKEFIRGIPNYTIQLARALKKRNMNEYSLSFFDFGKERGNRNRILSHFSDLYSENEIFECNSLDFRNVMRGIGEHKPELYNRKKYSEYIGFHPDLYHLPESSWVPENIDAPVVVTLHDIMPVIPRFEHLFKDKFLYEFRASLEYILNREYELIADSENTRQDVLNIFDYANPERIHVIPIGYSEDIFFPDFNLELIKSFNINSPYILYLGALDARKGLLDILTAYEQISVKYRDVKLVLAGHLEPDHASQLKPLIDKGTEQRNIILTGYVSEKQKRVLMSNAEMFLFPSEYEGFGLPVLEAMACGTPVITSNVSSLPEVGGDAVLYVTPKQPELLAETIIKLLDSEETRKIYRQKGLERCKKFSWDKTAELTEDIYIKAYENQAH